MIGLIIKRLIMGCMLAANFISRRVKKMKYETGGRCNRCGSCCRILGFKTNDKQLKSKRSLKLCVRWFSWFYGFDLLKIDHDRKLLFFSCRHWKKDKSCDDYFWRAPLCRNFPFSDPERKPAIIAACGYNTTGEND